MMDDELNTKSMMATLRGGGGRGRDGGMQVGRGPLEFAGQAEVLTVRAARQSSHQRRISEGGLAVCGDRA